jgi:Protein of unknown function (DUF4232)
MQTSRKHLWAAAVSLPVALALLTGCSVVPGSHGSIVVDGTVGPLAVATATTSPTAAAEPGADSDPTVTATARPTSAVGSSSTSTSAKVTACTGATMKVTVSELTRPINHLLITARNIGSTPCFAYYAPVVSGENKRGIAVLDESAPEAVVRLAPGKSAYAGLMTAAGDGSGKHGSEVHELAIQFVGKNVNGGAGTVVHVAVPYSTEYIDDTAFVTHWLPSAANVQTW